MLGNLLLNMLYESIILWCCQWPNAWTFILFSSRVKLEVRVAGQVCWHSWSCFTLLTGPSAIPSPVIRLVKSDDLTAAWECQSCPPLATELFIKSGQATHFSFPDRLIFPLRAFLSSERLGCSVLIHNSSWWLSCTLSMPIGSGVLQ